MLSGARVGHAGTLDPAATGVLVICVGKATKISSFLMEGEKEYVGTGRLGLTTDTQDADGEVLREHPVDVEAEDVRRAAAAFVGEIEQIPPMYSAVKVGGQKLYRLARKGREIERPARRATVHAFEIGRVALPEFDFVLRCSKGTYVRTILHDLGEALGCGGHLARLARERQGSFSRRDAVSWESLLDDRAAEIVRAAGVAPHQALEFLTALEVPRNMDEPLRVGVQWPDESAGPHRIPVRLVKGGDRTVGVGRVTDDGVRVVYAFPVSRGGFGRGRRR